MLTKGTYQAFITCLDRWHRDVCLWHLVPSLSSAPFLSFFQLLSAYYVSLVLWVCLYFSSFLFAAIILLFEVPSYFISWNNQVSMYFFTDFTSKCISTENFLWFELNCRNVSGSLGKQEMIWEQEVVSTCFNNFSVSPANLDEL